jgi:hypothetical protein
MGGRRSVSLVFVVWVVIGVIVAYNNHYFASLTTLLWPLILLGTKITLNI